MTRTNQKKAYFCDMDLNLNDSYTHLAYAGEIFTLVSYNKDTAIVKDSRGKDKKVDVKHLRKV